MEKNWLYLFYFSITLSFGQVVNIPDPAFKALLLQSVGPPTNTIAINCITGSPIVDTNGNGEIEESEALQICNLYITSGNIQDLTGLEKFTNLQYLFCGGNTITSLPLATLTQLKYVACQYNQINAIDVSNLPHLERLYCINNPITSIVVGNNPMLKAVHCTNNLLHDLDFSACPVFKELDCSNNPNLTSINIQNGATQLFGTATFYNWCWSNCPNLQYVCADANEIPPMQSYLASCNFSTANITLGTNCALGISNTPTPPVKTTVSPNPTSGLVDILFHNPTTTNMTLALYDPIGRLLTQQLIDNETQDYVLDMSHYSAGNYFVKIIDATGKAYTLKIIKQ